jgi:hypothetical protein
MAKRNGRYFAAFGIVALLLVGAAPATAQEEPKASADERGAAPNPKANSSQSMPDLSAESVALDREANRIAERANLIADVQSAYAFWQTALGAAGVFFTGFAAIFAWRATHWAREAAFHAKAGVRISKEISDAQLRAYMRLKTADLSDLVVGQEAVAVIEFDNCGQSPAHDVVVVVCGLVTSHPDSASFAVAETEAPSRATFFPGQGGSTTISLGVWTESDAQRFDEGQRVVFVFGRIAYLDANDTPRQTNFRLVHDRMRRPGYLGKWHEGNDAT